MLHVAVRGVWGVGACKGFKSSWHGWLDPDKTVFEIELNGSIQLVDMQSSIMRSSYNREVAHSVHRVPLLAKGLADLAGAHHLVGGRYL